MAIAVCPVAVVVLAAQQATVWDGVYTLEQAARGEKLYAQHCAQCHGDTLGGVESAPPLTGDQFNGNWEGLALGDLFERMRVSMPLDRPGTLSRAENADILAHVLRVGGFPSGEKPLDAGALASIRYVTYKPQEERALRGQAAAAPSGGWRAPAK
jgi:mono/diheme cytochrome c family protein